jgi:hypothetical protein
VDDGLPAKQILAQDIGRVNRDQPLLKHANTVTQSLGFGQVMRAQENGPTLTAERLDEVAHRLCGLRIQGRCRFIKKDDWRLME